MEHSLVATYDTTSHLVYSSLVKIFKAGLDDFKVHKEIEKLEAFPDLTT